MFDEIGSESITSQDYSKGDRMVQAFYSKLAQIIINSRHQSSSSKASKWFNLWLMDLDSLKSELKFWKAQAITDPHPLIIDIYLDISQAPQLSLNDVPLTNELNSIDANGSIFRKSTILLESWHLLVSQSTYSGDLSAIYKRNVIFFRSLYAYVRLLPTYRLWRNISRGTEKYLKIGYRLSTSKVSPPHEIPFEQLGDPRKSIAEYNFNTIVNPHGTFALHVIYRSHCLFSTNIPRVISSKESLARPLFIKSPRDLQSNSRSSVSPHSLPIPYPQNAFSSDSDSNNHDISFPSSLGRQIGDSGFSKKSQIEFMFPVDFDFSNPPFPIENPKIGEAETVSISNKVTDARAVPLLRRPTHTFQPSFNQSLVTSPVNGPLFQMPINSTPSVSLNQPNNISINQPNHITINNSGQISSPLIPPVFTPSSSFGNVHPSQSLLMGISPPALSPNTTHILPELSTFMRTIQEIKHQRSISSTKSISSGVFSLEQTPPKEIHESAESRKLKSSVLLEKFETFKDKSEVFSKSLFDGNQGDCDINESEEMMFDIGI